MKYTMLRNDWFHYTSKIEHHSFLKKLRRVQSNPGMKMVLFNRFINETPNYLFVLKGICKFFYHRMMFKYGIDLPLNLNFGYNLRIYHFGGIIINPEVVIGNNCTIMHGVTIGNTMRDNKCPIISDEVFIGAGAKVIGNVFLAKKIKIGANAVVTKSIKDEEVTVIGIPAKILRKEGDETKSS